MCELAGVAGPASIVIGKSGNRPQRKRSYAASSSGWRWRIVIMAIAASQCCCSGKGLLPEPRRCAG